MQSADGRAKERNVAVKRLRANHTDVDRRGLLQEVDALKVLGAHKYLVKFVWR
jgi:hypothetical protein